jgi:hypothetical protein
MLMWKKEMLPNVVAEWLTFLLRIPDVPGSNLSLRPAIQTKIFVVSGSPSNEIPGKSLSLGHDRFLPMFFQFIIYLSPFHWTLYEIPGKSLSLGHDRFLPMFFQFIIYLSPFHWTLYSLSFF